VLEGGTLRLGARPVRTRIRHGLHRMRCRDPRTSPGFGGGHGVGGASPIGMAPPGSPSGVTRAVPASRPRPLPSDSVVKEPPRPEALPSARGLAILLCIGWSKPDEVVKPSGVESLKGVAGRGLQGVDGEPSKGFQVPHSPGGMPHSPLAGS
jgi:hypothetical protein